MDIDIGASDRASDKEWTIATGDTHVFKVAQYWLEIVLVDEAGTPVANAPYKVEGADGKVFEDKLDDQGKARIDDVQAEQCTVSFPGVDTPWERVKDA